MKKLQESCELRKLEDLYLGSLPRFKHTLTPLQWNLTRILKPKDDGDVDYNHSRRGGGS